MENTNEIGNNSMYAFMLNSKAPCYRIEVKDIGVEISVKDDTGVRIANTLDEQKDLLFVMRNIDSEGFTRMLQENDQICEFVSMCSPSMKLLVDRIKNKSKSSNEAKKLLEELDLEEMRNVPKGRVESDVFNMTSIHSVISDKAYEYYQSFTSSPDATMRDMGFDDKLDEFMNDYLYVQLSNMVGKFVDAVSDYSSVPSAIDGSVAQLYEDFKDLLVDIERNLKVFFIEPPEGIYVYPEHSIDDVMGYIENAGYAYLEEMANSVVRTSSNALEDNSVKLGG